MPAPIPLKICLVSLGLTASAAALAQAAPTAALERDAPRHDRTTQRVEVIRVEGDSVRIDEVRTGGETRSITVQPKADVPAYDVQPADVTRRAPSEAAPGGSGPRTWKVFSF
jgi:hypothetical protein